MTPPTDRFFIPGGTLPQDAPSYVARQADEALLQSLRRGEFCYVLTARQLGKSSLMVRAAARLKAEGFAVAVLDLTAIGHPLTAEPWYRSLAHQLGRRLGREREMDAYWRVSPEASPLQKWLGALRLALGEEGEGARPLVVFLDEIDLLRSLPFPTDEFFAAIRACYNQRPFDAVYERLTFCLLGVATPSDLIRDTRLTPFNIGRRIPLHDFTPEEAALLAPGLSADEPVAEVLLERILYWTGGHPYLTQVLCQSVREATGGGSLPADIARLVDGLCEELFFSAGARARNDNLVFVRDRLLSPGVDRAGALELYGRALAGQRVADDETHALVHALKLSGVVRSEGGFLKVRNRIYARVLDRRWIEEQMPGAELRRQRRAYRLGALRAASVAALVVAALGMASLSLFFRDRAGRAERARVKEGRLRGEAERARDALQRLNRAFAVRQAYVS